VAVRLPLAASDAEAAPAVWYDADDLRWAVRHWAARLGVKAPQIHLRPMRRKWASISTSGRLTLSTELLALPRRLGEFVVVHELVHLLAPNHGRLHKSFLYAYLPDWEERQRDLQKYGRAAGARGSLQGRGSRV
jgi:predicted metal-dependent hydrolase